MDFGFGLDHFAQDKGKGSGGFAPEPFAFYLLLLLYAVGGSECAIYFFGYVADLRLVMGCGGARGY